MVLDLRTIPEGHSDVSHTVDLVEFKDDLPQSVEPIICRAAIDRNGSELFIHLLFSGKFEQECSRCLRKVIIPIEGEPRLVVRESHGKFGPSIDDDAVDFYYDSAHQYVDLSPAIYEEVITALPLQPLCSLDCKGIEISEQNRKISDLLSNNEIDPRWEALKKFRT